MSEGDAGDERPYALRRDDGVVLCSCGDRLADRINGDTVVIDGVEFQFRRRNDAMTCRSCGATHPMRQFRRDPEFGQDTGQRRRSSD